jgi:4-diphosphocytidyl-2-C-methyl-D-erythritol kinase
MTGPPAVDGPHPGRPVPPVTLVAPAKLTLSLAVTGVREDGYHLLRSEMVSIDLADTLTFSAGEGLTMATPDDATPPVDLAAVAVGPDNLITRALMAVGRSAAVRVIKRIPVGAGLGGGSADAAAVLRWAGCTDLGVAAGLGADVPFCLAGGRALVGGIGERLEPLPFQPREFTLLLLPFGVDTGAVYRAWDRRRTAAQSSGSGSSGNDLEAPALEVEPRLGPWRDLLHRITGLTPRMAGSGSTWFVEGSPAAWGAGPGPQALPLGDQIGWLVPVTTVPGHG